ncbi:hypothetical protein BpHYR1_005682 [Brachionus plicatilis]|uniref:Uncharacterized protein n=1 Tax=Brachionus plicatilis TaxID=10195 RepID=A0A3M7QTS1_BRAPC|nr:hypothetical protein BpHYR1_005682 [Brachionus plicatilis]
MTTLKVRTPLAIYKLQKINLTKYCLKTNALDLNCSTFFYFYHQFFGNVKRLANLSRLQLERSKSLPRNDFDIKLILSPISKIVFKSLKQNEFEIGTKYNFYNQ